MTAIEQHTTARPAAAADHALVVSTLTDAFLDDPIFRWILPDPAQRRALTPRWFDVWVTAYARHHETYVVGDGAIEGAALWAPPGVDGLNAEDDAAFDAEMADMPEDAIERLVTCVELFGASHPHEPNWYLHFLGVDPVHQGRGHGSTLLRRVLDVADQRGEPAYLDATSARNRALYERHGFRSIAENVMPDGPTAYAMWREPRS